MFLHLGEDRYVRCELVEALLDCRLFDKLPVNRQFLGLARGEGRLEQSPAGLPAETVVLAGRRVILSPLSRRTLARRWASGPPWDRRTSERTPARSRKPPRESP